MIYSPTNCPDNVTTSRRERPLSCSQNFSCAALRHAVSFVSVAAASVANEGRHLLWGSCGRPISPPPSFSVWFRPTHLSFFSPSGFGPPCIPIYCSTRLSAPRGSRESKSLVESFTPCQPELWLQLNRSFCSTGIRGTVYWGHRLFPTIVHRRGARPLAN